MLNLSQCLLEAKKFPVSNIANTITTIFIDDNLLNRDLMKHDIGSNINDGSLSSKPQQNDFNSPENYLEAQ